MPNIHSTLLFKEYASFLLQGDTILLFCEKTGKHWACNQDVSKIVCSLKDDGRERTFFRVVQNHFPEANEEDAIIIFQFLWETGLFKEKGIRQPSLLLRWEFILWNIWYQLLVKLFGWKPVATIRLSQKRERKKDRDILEKTPEIVEVFIAAARWSYGLPFVSAACVPTSLAFYRMLKRRKKECFLLIGTPSPFLPHIWCDYQGFAIDPLVFQASYDCYQSCV